MLSCVYGGGGWAMLQPPPGSPCVTGVLTCPAGYLVHGVPGVGKSTAVGCVVEESGMPVHTLGSADSVQGVTGALERHVAAVLRAAEATAPSFLVLDNVEDLVPEDASTLAQVWCAMVASPPLCMCCPLCAR